MSPVRMLSRPSKGVQELLARDWRQKWRAKLGNDHSVLREVYEHPKGMWNRSLFIICTIWTFIAGSIFFVLVLVGLWDLLIWVLIFVPVILIFFFMYGIIAMNDRQRPGWSVVQITRKYFIYTWAYTPDLDFLEMVRSEDPVIYPLVAAELESITEIKKGFGSSFVRKNPGGPDMVIIAAKFGPGSSYGEGWEEEFPIPVSILPELLKKVREIAPTIKIEAGLEKT